MEVTVLSAIPLEAAVVDAAAVEVGTAAEAVEATVAVVVAAEEEDEGATREDAVATHSTPTPS